MYGKIDQELAWVIFKQAKTDIAILVMGDVLYIFTFYSIPDNTI